MKKDDFHSKDLLDFIAERWPPNEVCVLYDESFNALIDNTKLRDNVVYYCHDLSRGAVKPKD